MRSSRLCALLTIHLLACDSDKGVQVFNPPPTAEITSHSDGDEVSEGYAAEFRAELTDPNNPVGELQAQWYAGGTEVCPMLPPNENGTSICTAVIGLEEGEVEVVVKDPQNAAGSAGVSLSVIPTDAPTAAIILPDAEGVFYSDQLITFQGLASDSEDSPQDLVAFWESSIDAILDVEAEPGEDGGFTGFGYLGEGDHGLTLHVEDTTGKTASESITVTVGPPNSAPSCAITEPVTGSVVLINELVTFEAQASDADVPADWLAVSWSSDKDGELGSSTPTSAGEITFPYSALTADTHVISMTVTDELGETCTDNLVLTIGTPPTVSIISPNGDTYNEGTPITFEAQVTDSEDPPEDIAVQWESSIGGTFSSQGSDSNGTVLFTLSDLAQGPHTLIVTAEDSAGLTATDSTTFTVNGLPTAPAVAISPEPAYTDDALTASASGSSDPENDPISYSYEWLLNGSATGLTGAILPSTETSKGETWTARATPSDGMGSGDYAEAAATILNHPPAISGVSISPGTGVSPNAFLTCSASITDADASDILSTTYAWTVGGASAGSGSTLQLDPSFAAAGDIVECTVGTWDGTDSAGGSASVLIDNTDPAMAAVSIVTAAPHYNDSALECIASATDADGDAISYTFSWTNQSAGTLLGSGTSAGASSTVTLSAAVAAPTDDIRCQATADDGLGGTATGSDTAALDNRAPSMASATLSSAGGFQSGETIACTPSATDADGDSLSLSYSWTSNGLALGSTADSYAVVPGSVSVGADITCTATATDPWGGTDSASASAILENSAPLLSVSISPAAGIQLSTALTCTESASDPDGSVPSVTLEWFNGSAAIGSGPTLQLSSLIAAAGDTVTCAATAIDADDVTVSVAASDSVSVDNTPPELTDLSIAPDPAATSDVLLASYTAIDADGHSVSCSFEWFVDDGTGAGAQLIAGVAGASLDGELHFEKNQLVYAVATPNDGIQDGLPATSNSLVIQNTPPLPPVLSTLPASVPEGGVDDLVCMVDSQAPDEDGDPLVYSFAWTQTTGSGSAAFTGASDTSADSTVPGTSTACDDIWECAATVTDGTDSATATASISVRACFNGTGSWTSQEAMPDPLTSHVAMMDTGGNRVLVYGGQSYYKLSEDLYEYSMATEEWALLSPTGVGPAPLAGHSGAYDETTEQWLVFGGQSYYSLTDELFVLDAATTHWDQPAISGDSPDPRTGHAAAMDGGTGTMYVFGGQTYYSLLADLWAFDLAAQTWTEIYPTGDAQPLAEAAAAYDPEFHALYVFGGQGYYGLSETVHCLDLGSMEWSEAVLTGDSLPPMHQATAAWTEGIAGFLVYGGQTYYSLLDTAYAVVPTGICQAEATAVAVTGDTPPALRGGALVHDAASGDSLLVGGQGYYTLYDSVLAFRP
jgi:hypothetical protein